VQELGAKRRAAVPMSFISTLQMSHCIEKVKLVKNPKTQFYRLVQSLGLF